MVCGPAWACSNVGNAPALANADTTAVPFLNGGPLGFALTVTVNDCGVPSHTTGTVCPVVFTPTNAEPWAISYARAWVSVTEVLKLNGRAGSNGPQVAVTGTCATTLPMRSALPPTEIVVVASADEAPSPATSAEVPAVSSARRAVRLNI